MSLRKIPLPADRKAISELARDMVGDRVYCHLSVPPDLIKMESRIRRERSDTARLRDLRRDREYVKPQRDALSSEDYRVRAERVYPAHRPGDPGGLNAHVRMGVEEGTEVTCTQCDIDLLSTGADNYMVTKWSPDSDESTIEALLCCYLCLVDWVNEDVQRAR